MATTIDEVVSRAEGGLNWTFVKLTAGVADTTATYVVAGFPEIKEFTLPIKTTGTVGACSVTYALATGTITVACGNSDVLRFGFAY
jgi:hypothetical protein